MAIIHCPTCGDPVKVTGDRWECSWCLDFGPVSSLLPSERAKLESDHYYVYVDFSELEEGVEKIQTGMRLLYENPDTVRRMTWDLFAFSVSQALLKTTDNRLAHTRYLELFYKEYPYFEMWKAVKFAFKKNKAYLAESFALNGETVGTFWKDIMPKLVPHSTNASWAETEMKGMLEGISQIEAIFSKEEESEIFERLWNALRKYWDDYAAEMMEKG